MSKNIWLGTDGTTPTNWGTADNWTLNAVPVNTDDVYLRNSSVNIDSGLNQSAVTLNSLNIAATMLGTIGTAAAWLQVSATSWRIGDPGGDSNSQNSAGSTRVKIDFGSVKFSGVVVASNDSSADAGLEPILVKGTNASNELYVLGGRVGVATVLPTDSATLATWSISGSSAVLNLGIGVTWINGYQTGGSVQTNTGGSSFTQEGGTALIQGSDVIRSLTVGGACTMNARPLAQTVSSITQAAGTATANCTAHGYVVGDVVYMAGANEADYNGFKTITAAAANTFSYAVPSTAPASATGSPTALKAIQTLTGVSGGIADFSADSRDVAVQTLVAPPGFTVKPNSARAQHLIIGTRTQTGVSEITYA